MEPAESTGAVKSIRNMWTIVKRELYTYFSSPIAYIFIIIFLALAGFFTFQVGNFFARNQADLRPFFTWHPWLYLFFVPAIGMRLWSEERRSGSIELLFSLPITAGQVIIGKFLAAWIFLGVALTLTFPIVLTVTYLGDPDIGAIFTGYIGSFLIAGVYLAFSSIMSALSRNQVISFILAMVVCLVIAMAGWPPVTDMFVQWAPNAIVSAISEFSIMPHFQSMQKGIISLQDVLYALSMVVFGLFATGAVLQSLRSR